MNYLHYCVAGLLCVAVSCSNKGDDTAGNQESAGYSGVEYQSQHLIYGVDTVAENLRNPWGIAFLPDGRMLVTERAGRILIFRNGQKLDQEIEIPDVFVHGQGGLMDIKLHPDYDDNGWIYLSYAKKGAGGGGTVIARTRIEDNALAGFEELFAAQPLSNSGVHFGSRITFDGNGHMFFSSGERGTKENAQSLENHLGKILRLNDDGSVPEDNPFSNTPGAKPEIWSYGHRNPQGLFYDADAERLWAVEHGPRGGDELNLVEKGKNYGWPQVTYGVNYDGTPITDKTEAHHLEKPLTWWDPSIGPCGMTKVSGNRYAGWKNSLFIGALALKHIARVEISDGKLAAQEKLIDQLARVRAVAEGPDEYIYVATEGPGMLLKLRPLRKAPKSETGVVPADE